MSSSSFAKSRVGLLIGVAGIAAIVLIAAIVISQSGTKKDTPKGSAAAKKVEKLLAGIPQRGPEIGDPNAPVAIEEFVDMQCPFCKEFSTQVLPELITKYVRTGKVKIRLRTLTFLGDQAGIPDSDTAARFAHAAGLQNKMWNFSELFFYDQGEENSGYVTDGFIRKIAKQINGLDVDKLFKDRETQAAVKPIDQDATLASAKEVSSTPSFLIGPSGKPLEKLENVQLEVGFFTDAIDKALKENTK